MNKILQAPAETSHHRLLEGVLLRLARLPDARCFVLRGGMLLRHWFRPLARPAGDLDLVCTLPFSVEETGRRFVPLLADRGIDDGVTFDPERFRVEGIWLHTTSPGVRLFASGEVDGIEDEFSVDVTFGEPLIPAPILGDYPTRGSGLTARLLDVPARDDHRPEAPCPPTHGDAALASQGPERPPAAPGASADELRGAAASDCPVLHQPGGLRRATPVRSSAGIRGGA